jgi:hypothetical protein
VGTVFSVPFIPLKPASYTSIGETEEVEDIVRMGKVELRLEETRWVLLKKDGIERKEGNEECTIASPVKGSRLSSLTTVSADDATGQWRSSVDPEGDVRPHNGFISL